MNIPENCRECEHNATCDKAYYGGGLCKYQDAIECAAVDRQRKMFHKELAHESK